MVTSLVAANSDAKVTSNERASIVSSAKMHLSIFKAQAIYLRETGAQPKEISEMIRELYSSFGNIPVPISAPAPAINVDPPKPKRSINACNLPQKIRVVADHVPGTQQEVLARRDDYVIVYAWVENKTEKVSWGEDKTEAVAYNLTNKTAGRIPRAVLEVYSSEPYDQDKMCLAQEDVRTLSLGHITWKAGDYIRVWGRVEHPRSQCTGFGFNVASGQIGKINTYSGGLKPVE